MKGVEYLNSLPQWSAGAFSPLDIPKKILEALDNPQDRIKTIHVAGTNGKGSTCAALSLLLTKEGFKTGFFSSPHLINVTERCRINNRPISIEKFDYYLMRVAEIANWNNLAMTYFVATTCASFLCFAEEKVDYAVIEVGLGGKFDATNLIKKPELAIITSIDFDHVDLLGPGIVEIAENKAGIIKDNSKILLGNLNQEAKTSILKVAKEKNAEVFYSKSLTFNSRNEFMRSSIGQDAASLAIAASKILGYNFNSEILNDLTWPGRLQEIELENKSRILLDGAHNPAGVKALFAHLRKIIKRENLEKITLFLGLKQRAGWEETAKTVADELKSFEVEVELMLIEWDEEAPNLEDYFGDCTKLNVQDLLQTNKTGYLVVTGSLYLAGCVLKELKVVEDDFLSVS